MSITVRIHSTDAINLTDSLLLSKTYNTTTDAIENLDISSIRSLSYIDKAILAALKSLEVSASSGGGGSTVVLSGNGLTEIYSPTVLPGAVASHPGALPLAYTPPTNSFGDWTNVSYIIPTVSTTFSNAPGSYIRQIDANASANLDLCLTVAHLLKNTDVILEFKFQLWSDDASPTITDVPSDSFSVIRVTDVFSYENAASQTIHVTGTIPSSLTGTLSNNFLVLVCRFAEGSINAALAAYIGNMFLVGMNRGTVLKIETVINSGGGGGGGA